MQSINSHHTGLVLRNLDQKSGLLQFKLEAIKRKLTIFTRLLKIRQNKNHIDSLLLSSLRHAGLSRTLKLFYRRYAGIQKLSFPAQLLPTTAKESLTNNKPGFVEKEPAVEDFLLEVENYALYYVLRVFKIKKKVNLLYQKKYLALFSSKIFVHFYFQKYVVLGKILKNRSLNFLFPKNILDFMNRKKVCFDSFLDLRDRIISSQYDSFEKLGLILDDYSNLADLDDPSEFINSFLFDFGAEKTFFTANNFSLGNFFSRILNLYFQGKAITDENIYEHLVVALGHLQRRFMVAFYSIIFFYSKNLTFKYYKKETVFLPFLKRKEDLEDETFFPQFDWAGSGRWRSAEADLCYGFNVFDEDEDLNLEKLAYAMRRLREAFCVFCGYMSYKQLNHFFANKLYPLAGSTLKKHKKALSDFTWFCTYVFARQINTALFFTALAPSVGIANEFIRQNLITVNNAPVQWRYRIIETESVIQADIILYQDLLSSYHSSGFFVQQFFFYKMFEVRLKIATLIFAEYMSLIKLLTYKKFVCDIKFLHLVKYLIHLRGIIIQKHQSL
jgi:hypothetical protein